ncbi:hypothetical protein [Pseudarthrobacter sp. PvP090]|uniref:hypothetical protein n=1 Tax=Pseudarthrobacter sp. PvP090 TaxID=3156393 RepID=UPI003395B053
MVEGRRRWAPALNHETAGLPDDTGSLADDHGIGVPSQLSLIGYDNSYLVRNSTAPVR